MELLERWGSGSNTGEAGTAFPPALRDWVPGPFRQGRITWGQGAGG